MTGNTTGNVTGNTVGNMIRNMEAWDIPRVAEIHVYGWRYAYRDIVSDEYLFNKILVSKRMEFFQNALANKRTEDYVYDDGIVKAMMTIGKCRDEDKPASFELWGIYVEPLMKGRGIGSEMVRFCEAKARERGFSEVCLWVFEKNAAARAFYEKMGYGPDGTVKYIDFLANNELRYEKRLIR